MYIYTIAEHLLCHLCIGCHLFLFGGYYTCIVVDCVIVVWRSIPLFCFPGNTPDNLNYGACLDLAWYTTTMVFILMRCPRLFFLVAWCRHVYGCCLRENYRDIFMPVPYRPILDKYTAYM